MREIKIQELLKVALDRVWLIVAVAVLSLALAFSYCSFVETPVYSTGCSILVNNGALTTNETSSTISSATMSASLYLVETCVDVCKSDNLFKELEESMNREYTYKQLRGLFQIDSRSKSSLFIDISVVNANPDEAKRIANAYLDILPAYMNEVIPAVDIKVMSTADSFSKVSPHTVRISVLAMILGAVATYAVCAIISLLNNTISSEEDFKNHFDLPLLGVIPNFDPKKTKGGRYGYGYGTKY